MTRNILFYIIDILKDSDENYKYTRKSIERELKNYGVCSVERHTIRRSIDVLNEVGFDIVVEEGKENKFFLRERMFEEWEIKLLCDIVNQCNFLDKKDITNLIDKLKNFTGKSTIDVIEDANNINQNQSLFGKSTKYVIDTLLKAISSNKKVSFSYCEYDKTLQKSVKDKIYVINPYKLLLKNGHYYLLLNKRGYEDVAFYRVDRIEKVNILDEERDSLEKILGENCNQKIKTIIQRRLYNYGGENIKLVLRVKRNASGEIIDNFFEGTIVLDSNNEFITVAVDSTKSEGLFYWLMQHLETIEVIKPKEIREELIERVMKAMEKYKKDL